MKHRTIPLITALVLALPALATPPAGNRNDASATSSSGAQADAQAGALSASQAVNSTSVHTGALAGAVSGPSTSSATNAASTGASTSNATAGDSRSSVVFNAAAAPASTTATLKAAPDVVIAGPASGPCTGTSGGVGASWLGGGLGFNAATVDEACTLRENIRVLSMVLPALRSPEAAEVRALVMQLVRQLAAAPTPATPTVTASLPRELQP